MTSPAKVVVIRAEPGLSATLARCDAMGLPSMGEPMFAVEPVTWEMPDPARFDGVVLGSANAIRHGGEQLDAVKGLPAYCVGEATAEAARNAGFGIAQIGVGGLQNLLDELAGQSLALLRLAGEKHVPLDLPDRLKIEQRIVYRSRALPMPARIAETLAGGAIVLLHSAEAARHFAEECERLALDRSAVDSALIGPRLERAVGIGWRSVGWPDTPDDAALVAFADTLWQNRS